MNHSRQWKDQLIAMVWKIANVQEFIPHEIKQLSMRFTKWKIDRLQREKLVLEQVYSVPQHTTFAASHWVTHDPWTCSYLKNVFCLTTDDIHYKKITVTNLQNWGTQLAKLRKNGTPRIRDLDDSKSELGILRFYCPSLYRGEHANWHRTTARTLALVLQSPNLKRILAILVSISHSLTIELYPHQIRVIYGTETK